MCVRAAAMKPSEKEATIALARYVGGRLWFRVVFCVRREVMCVCARVCVRACVRVFVVFGRSPVVAIDLLLCSKRLSLALFQVGVG